MKTKVLLGGGRFQTQIARDGTFELYENGSMMECIDGDGVLSGRVLNANTFFQFDSRSSMLFLCSPDVPVGTYILEVQSPHLVYSRVNTRSA